MRNLLLGLLVFACFSACQPGTEPSSSDNAIQEIRVEPKGPNASIIRNPVSANEPIDTVNVAKLVFEAPDFDFGEVQEGAKIMHTFRFFNAGKVPLLIAHAKSTCGCTVPKWPKNPIPPGGDGKIIVEFDTKNKAGFQKKPVTVTANTYPSGTKVFLIGKVNKKK